MSNHIRIANRDIGREYLPFIVAEIGINHEGNLEKAKRMVSDAHLAGADCAKFQIHIVDDEMVSTAKKVIPANATESIWDIMVRCALTPEEDRELQRYTRELGMIYLATPFSRAAADQLHAMDVDAYKIGSGECNNYPLVEHIASFGRPIILSTGMNNLKSIRPSVDILRRHQVPFALLHCVSMYPTPYERVQLGALATLQHAFPDAVIGLSDHSVGPYTAFGAIPLGASIIEKHFISDKTWPGPDVPISLDPLELASLVTGSRAIHAALGGTKRILKEEQPTIDFAYACVVTIQDISRGDLLTRDNLWVKRPGTGEIKAKDYHLVLGKVAARDIPRDTQLRWRDISK